MYIGSQEMKATKNSFIYANFNYCLLVLYFCSCKSSRKIAQIQKRCLRIILDDYRQMGQKKVKLRLLKLIPTFDQTILSLRHNTTKYGTKSLTTLGPQIWNTLPESIKSETCYSKLKKYINAWFELQCNCNCCRNYIKKTLSHYFR